MQKLDKEKLHQFVSELLAEKIQNAERMIEETRASNSETKSSMGDKYETGREMLQQELNGLQSRLANFLSLQDLHKRTPNHPQKKAVNGSLIKTSEGFFYISIPAGEVQFSNTKIFVISPQSPLAKALWNHVEGEQIIFNNKKIIISEIC